MKFRRALFFPYPLGGRNRSHHSASGRGSPKRQGRRSRHRRPRLVPEDGRGVGADQEGHRLCGVALHPVMQFHREFFSLLEIAIDGDGGSTMVLISRLCKLRWSGRSGRVRVIS